jgi:hypothetical protein
VAQELLIARGVGHLGRTDQEFTLDLYLPDSVVRIVLFEKRVHKFFGVERQQIAHFLANPDKSYGQS